MATNETVTLTAELKDEMSAPLDRAIGKVDNFTDAVVKGGKRQRDAVSKSTAQIGGDLGKQNRLFADTTNVLGRETAKQARLFKNVNSALEGVYKDAAGRLRKANGQFVSNAELTGTAAGRALAKQFGIEASKSEGEGRKAGKKAGDGFLSGIKKVGGLVAGYMGAQMIGGFIKDAATASDATDKFKATLGFAGLDTSAIDAATKASKAYADQTVYDLPTIQNMTAQLASNGIKDYMGLTKAAGNLNAVAGGNAETFKSVAMVMSQTAGQGKLTTENWNQLSDAIPGAAGPLMKAMKDAGAYTGNFRTAMEKGMITSDEFNAALMQLGTKPVAVEAAKSTKTFEGAIGNLQATINTKLMGALDKIKPAATTAITALGDGLGKALDWVGDAAQGLYDLIVKGDFSGSFRKAFHVEEDSTAVDILFKTRDGVKDTIQWLYDMRKPIGIIAGLITAVLIPHFVRLGTEAIVSAGKQRLAWAMAQGAAVKSTYVQLWGIGLMIAGWVVAGTQATIQAVKIAAGWLIAMGPVGWAIGIIALLVAAFVWAYNNVGWFKDGVDAAMRWVGDAVKNVTDWIVAAWGSVVNWWNTVLMPAIGSVGQFFADAWGGAVNWWNTVLLPAIQAVGQWFTDMFTQVGNWFRDFVGFFVDGWGMLTDFWNNTLFPIVRAVGDVFAAVFDWVRRLVWNATTIVMALWLKVVDFWNGVLFPALKAVGDWFKTIFDWIWANAVKPVIDFIVNGFTWLGNMLQATLTWINTTVIQPAVNFWVSVFNSVITWWNTVFIPGLQAFGNWIASVMAWIRDNIIVPYVNFWISVFQNIVTWWNTVFIPALQAFGNWIGSIMNWIYLNVIKPVVDGIIGAFNGIVDFWNGVLMPAAQSVGQWFSDVIGGAISGVQGFIGDLIKGFEGFISFWTATLKPVVDTIAQIFRDISSAIGDAIGKVGEFANNPLGGIQDWLGIKKDGNGQGIMPTPGASGGGVFGGNFAGGGILGGYAPGHDSILARLSPGESVLVPELTRAIGPQNIMAANAAASGGRPAGAGPSMTAGFSNRGRGGSSTTLNVGAINLNVPVSAAGTVDMDALREATLQTMQDALDSHNRRAY